jgi:hypothetical protein
MENNIPTAEELLVEEIKKFSKPIDHMGLQLFVINVANQHARNHVEAALKTASEKVKQEIACDGELTEHFNLSIKPSILNAYSLNNIK